MSKYDDASTTTTRMARGSAVSMALTIGKRILKFKAAEISKEKEEEKAEDKNEKKRSRKD